MRGCIITRKSELGEELVIGEVVIVEGNCNCNLEVSQCRVVLKDVGGPREGI